MESLGEYFPSLDLTVSPVGVTDVGNLLQFGNRLYEFEDKRVRAAALLKFSLDIRF